MKLIYKNLTIRDASIHDAKSLCAWWNDGEVMAHAGFPNGLNYSVEDVIDLINNYPLNKRLFILEADNKKIGEANIDINNDIGSLGINICEKQYQEKGYGRLYLSMLIEKLFESVDTIILDTNYKNHRARHVYEMLGFKIDTIKENGFVDQLGVSQDVIYYRLDKKDFKNYLDDYYLCKPSLRHLDTINDYRNSILKAKEDFQGTSRLENIEDPKDWLEDNRRFENEDEVPQGYVIGFEYCLVDRSNDEILGMINIRPYIEENEYLKRFGGNIGYSVKPNKRKRGYCKRMLMDALKICKDKFGLDKVLITCNNDNIASEKVIRYCGGQFIDELYIPEVGKTVKRFNINLKDGK